MKMRTRLELAFLGLVVHLALAPTIAADDQSPGKPNLRVVSFGAFLGYLDGFVEHPAGAWDSLNDINQGPLPSGGLLGVRDWLTQHDDHEPRLLLVTGNNLPTYDDTNVGGVAVSPLDERHVFWSTLATTHPTAVAFGVEDFARALQAGDGAGALSALVASKQIPFLASNAIVREHGAGLNTVRQGGMLLDVPADDSVGLVDTLTIACGACRGVPERLEGVAALLDRGAVDTTPAGPVAPPVVLDAERTPDQHHLKISLEKAPLRPGRLYRLVLQTLSPVSFEFRTVRVLTPHRSAFSSLDGLPLIAPTTWTTEPQSIQPIVLAFVSANIKQRVSASHWQWSAASAAPTAPCFAERCEIDFLAPVDALRTWARLTALPHAPLYMAILDADPLEEAALLTQDHGDETPRLRIIVHHPDTTSLGRAAPATDVYSGDLGYHAILNGNLGGGNLTQVWVRPEWVGEAVHVLETRAEPGQDPSRVQLSSPSAQVSFVRGLPLRYEIQEPGSAHPRIQYVVIDNAGRKILVDHPYPLYAPYSHTALTTDGLPQGELWTNESTMTAFLLDLARRQASADLAVMPVTYIDGDMAEWLSDELHERQAIPWLSQFFFKRALLHAEPLVKTSVEGSALVALLKKMLDVAKGSGYEVCTSGIAAKCPTTAIDADHVRLNGREIVPAHFYAIVLPQSLAQQLEIKRHLSEPIEFTTLLASADARLVLTSPTPLTEGCVSPNPHDPHCLVIPHATRDKGAGRKGVQMDQRAQAAPHEEPPPDLPGALENRMNRSSRFYASLQPMNVSARRVLVKQPATDSFGSIPVEGRDVEDERDLSFGTSADLGWDRPRFVLHALGDGHYATRQLASGITYPSDEWTAGARFDYKVNQKQMHHIFAGLFRQSWFRDHREKAITPKRTLTDVTDSNGDVFSTVVQSLDKVTPTARAPLYTFARVGLELEPIGKDTPVQFRAFSANIDYGRIKRDRQGVIIAGVESTLEDLLAKGVGGLIDQAVTSDLSLSHPTVEYKYGQRTQSRAVFTGSMAVKLGRWGGDDVGLFTLDGEYRQYLGNGNAPKLTTRHSIELKAKIVRPLFGRVSIGPAFNWYRVDAGADRPFIVSDVSVEVLIPVFSSLGIGRVAR
jgi:hypothetical protein